MSWPLRDPTRRTASKRSGRLRFQNRVLLPALVAAGPAWLLVAVLLWYSDERRRAALDAVRVRERVLSDRARGHAPARRTAAALAREHARSAARGRLLDAGPQHRSRGLDGRGHGRGELARPNAARPAARGARGRRAASEGDRGRRYRGVRVRLAPATAARESTRRGVARRNAEELRGRTRGASSDSSG